MNKVLLKKVLNKNNLDYFGYLMRTCRLLNPHNPNTAEFKIWLLSLRTCCKTKLPPINPAPPVTNIFIYSNPNFFRNNHSPVNKTMSTHQ